MNDWGERFYRAYETWGVMKAVWHTGLPLEMVVSSPNKSGWVDWHFVKPEKSVSDELAAFEREISCQFPSSFKEWFGLYYTLRMDCPLVGLPECRLGNPLKDLRWPEANQPDYRYIGSRGLLPFGEEIMMDAGALCFDTRKVVPDSEWPIVFWDHEWVGTNKEISEPIFSSFQKMIECVTDHLETYQDREREAGWQERLFEIDPTGAGRTGRDYWLTWD